MITNATSNKAHFRKKKSPNPTIVMAAVTRSIPPGFNFRDAAPFVRGVAHLYPNALSK